MLSGYLITRLLLEEDVRGRIDLRAFYLRRAARLLPALLVLLPVYVVVFSRQLTPGALLVPVISTILYLSSFVQSIWGAMGNLGFTWSLSVEEHFYVLWPPLLRWLMGRRSAGRKAPTGRTATGRKARIGGNVRATQANPHGLAAAAVLAIVVASTVVRILLGGSFHGREFAYYSTFTRIDALGVGCLAALAGRGGVAALPARCAGLVGWLALGAIGWCYSDPDFTIGSSALDLYGLPLCAIAAAVLILAVVEQPASRLARLIAWRPLVHLGTISYGLYIWNLMPGQTFRVIEGRHPGPIGTIACALVILVIVELSFFWLERPLMRWARRRIDDRREDRDRRGSRARVSVLRALEYPRAG